MIRIQVTNDCSTPRVWFVEPYGDDIHLEPKAVLSIEFENPADLTIDVTLTPTGEAVWAFAGADGGDTLLPDDLKVDGSSIWPPKKAN
jgi:hypothetical protein